MSDLAEKVEALATYQRVHPLSAKLAVASVKRFVPEDKYQIQLHDLVNAEVDRVSAGLRADQFSVTTPFQVEEFLARVKRLESLIEILEAMLSTGCYWCKPGQETLWIQAIQRLSTAVSRAEGNTGWLGLTLYPALRVLYAGGISALAGGRTGVTYLLLLGPKVREPNGAVCSQPLHTWTIMSQRLQKLLPGRAESPTPLSDHLFDTLRLPLRDAIPNDDDFRRYFDLFEYLLCLVYMDVNSPDDVAEMEVGMPPGAFFWRYGRWPSRETEGDPSEEIQQEVSRDGNNWRLLQAGAFGGSLDRFWKVKKAADAYIFRWRAAT